VVLVVALARVVGMELVEVLVVVEGLARVVALVVGLVKVVE
jgi:hypothetical protein